MNVNGCQSKLKCIETKKRFSLLTYFRETKAEIKKNYLAIKKRIT